MIGVLKKSWDICGRIALASIFVTVALLSLSLLSTGLLMDRMNRSHSFGFFYDGDFWYRVTLIIISSIITMIIANLYVRRHAPEFLHVLKTSRISVKIAIVFVSICAGVLFISALAVNKSGPIDFGNPGWLFVLVTGVLSVGGIYLALQQIHDLRNSIVSFEDFVSRALDLIDRTEKGDFVKMLVLTPAMGCLVLERDRWRKLIKKLMSAEIPIQLTSLNVATMRQWFEQYKLTATDIPAMDLCISDGLQDAQNVINALKQQKYPGHSDVSLEPVLGEWTQVPRNYMVANSVRVIVCAPLFLPTPTSNPYQGTGTAHARRVQMVGFESQDFHIVESVHQEIDLRRKAIQKAAKEAETARVVEGSS